MEFVINLGLCNDKLACGLKFGQGILTTAWKSRTRTLATLRYQWLDFSDRGRLWNLDCRFICLL